MKDSNGLNTEAYIQAQPEGFGRRGGQCLSVRIVVAGGFLGPVER